MSVTVTAISKKFGSQVAVDELTFQAKPGEILGFLGPNGAGKSTTMKMLTGFLPPTSGSAEVAGFDVVKNSLEVRKRIGYLPEHNPVYRDMYVREYLQFIGRVHKISNSKARIDEMISLTGLEKEQHKLIGSLSKGYRQRVGLAQAMFHDPPVLILDEPISGLDPNQLAEIRELIRHLGKDKTVIFSTHIMQEVQAVCDRVIIIDQGKLVANDPIDRLQSRLKGNEMLTVGFLEEVSNGQLSAIDGVQRVQSSGHHRWKLTCKNDKDMRAELFRFAVANQLTLVELHRDSSSVEDVFQELTRSKTVKQ